jgi:dUTP pyrophosphatase
MKIKFKKLVDWAVAPKQGSKAAAGFDLTATSKKWNREFSVWEYGTGIAVEIPEGYAGFLFPRSSIYKTGFSLTNSVGLIDRDFRGEIMAKFADTYLGDVEGYDIGDRIGQLVIMPVPEVEYVEVEELSETERGAGGYGSTGK